MDTTRGLCEEYARDFAYFLEYLEYEWNSDFIVKVGQFDIDNPADLPLILQDLKRDEYEEFLDLYEESIDINDEVELSESILDYIVRYRPERLNDFYTFNHVWVEFRGVIIDPTQQQFTNAVIGDITENNYL